ncbi:MAG: hypothetical protein HYY68_02635 [Thaumarchaeota archaeon]|nr:hypothetical protein [Nitrososphaerota archaeon]
MLASNISGSASEVFELARLGNSRAAAEMLRQELERFQVQGHAVELCEWLVNCFGNLEEYGQAGNWYETAGELILSEQGSHADQGDARDRRVREGP